MMSLSRFLSTVFTLALLVPGASASMPPDNLTPAQRAAKSVAVLRGAVLKNESYRADDGEIYTRTWINVDEAFKAHCPPILTVVHRGGVVGKVGYHDDSNPDLRPGEEWLLFLTRRANGTLFAPNGSASAIKLRAVDHTSAKSRQPAYDRAIATELDELRRNSDLLLSGDVTDQAGVSPDAASVTLALQSAPASFPALSNLDVRFGNDSDFNAYYYPTRWVAPDRTAAIPYLIDATTRPTNISSNQVLFAVQSALNAWSNACGINFIFEGWTNFHNSSTSETNLDGSSRKDGKLRIQVHNTNNLALGADVVGLGGRYYVPLVPTSGWGSGGAVNSYEFHLAQSGAVVLDHNYVGFQNTNRLAEVLCHEIGHVLSLDHTSENPSEPTNSILYQSIMYGFCPHPTGTNRGAALGVMDGPDVRQVHPTNSTPPFTDYRVLDVVKGISGQPTNAGVNQVQLRGYDLQGTDLVLDYVVDSGGTVNGTFALNSSTLSFTPFTSAADGPRQDPADTYGTNYGRAFVRYLDGTNASAFGVIRVISISPDQYPAAISDGLPDAWMYWNFGTTDPASGPNLGPNDDFDGDGYTNLQEFLMGSNPADPRSNLRVLSTGTNFVTFQARPYDLYELETTSDFNTWSRFGFSLQPTASTGAFTNLALTNNSARFLRVRRVP